MQLLKCILRLAITNKCYSLKVTSQYLLASFKQMTQAECKSIFPIVINYCLSSLFSRALHASSTADSNIVPQPF